MMIGTHISKQKTYYDTIAEFAKYGVPAQIFTGSNKSWKRAEMDDSDLDRTKRFVTENNVRWFIHSIYLINMSRAGEEFEKAKEGLIYDLTIGPRLGIKGVVVHTGKALTMGEPTATTNMYNNIIGLLDHIDNSCPLLIETPAGQGTEILTTLDSFAMFYERFDESQREKVKICIDTCHVWSAGHDPMDYLERWLERFPGSLSLVHYNDSKVPKGARKDRHEIPGLGHIGVKEMDRISNWCEANDIPMVMEC